MFRLLFIIVLLAIILILVIPFVLYYAGINIFPSAGEPNQIRSLGYTAPQHFGSLIRTENTGALWQDASRPEDPHTAFPANIYSFIFDPNDKNVLFLGGTKSGLWKSINGGRTWNTLTDKADILDAQADIYAIKISRINPDMLLVAAYQNNYGRILQSSDGGNHFKEIYRVSAENKYVFDVIADSADSNHLLAATGEHTLIETINGGATWRVKKLFDTSLVRLVANPNDFRELYAITADGELIKSATGGNDWSIALGREQSPRAIEKYPPDIFDFSSSDAISGFNTVFALDPLNVSRLYLGTDTLLLRSSDAGMTWQEVNLLFAADLLPITALAIDPHDSKILFVAANHQMQKSIDDGATWSNVPFPASLGATKIFIHPQDSRIMFAVVRK